MPSEAFIQIDANGKFSISDTDYIMQFVQRSGTQYVLIEHHFSYSDIASDRLSVNVSIDNMFKIIFLEKGPISPRAHFRDFEHKIFMFLVP